MALLPPGVELKKALIGGITDQNVSYLAGHQQSKGCEVLMSTASIFDTSSVNLTYYNFHMDGAKRFACREGVRTLC